MYFLARNFTFCVCAYLTKSRFCLKIFFNNMLFVLYCFLKFSLLTYFNKYFIYVRLFPPYNFN